MAGSNAITTLVECPFKLTGVYAITVTGVGVNINSSSSSDVYWYRHAICRSGATGTATLPKSFLGHLAAALGSDWTVTTLLVSGKWKIKYTGAGTGTIVFGSGKGAIIRALLGLSSDVSLATNAERTSDYIPPYRIAAYERKNDSHWRAEGATGAAYSESGKGVVTGVEGGFLKQRRRWTWGSHPTQPSSLGGVLLATPALPDLTGAYTGRLTTPSEDLSATSPPNPWTMLDFWSAAKTRVLAGALGTFQGIFTGSTTKFTEFYVDANTCEKGPFISLRDAQWSELMDLGPWGFTLWQEGVS